MKNIFQKSNIKNSGVNTRLDSIAMKKTSMNSLSTRFLIAALASTALLASHSPAFASGGITFVTRNVTNSGLGSNDVRGVYANGSSVYAATFGGLSISTDGGITFTNRTTANGLGDNIVLGVYANGSSVYAATNGGLSISTDGGASFINRTPSDGLGFNPI